MSDATHGPPHVGRDEAERIAALARLRFDESELGRITEELNRILDHVEDLRSLESRTADERPSSGRSDNGRTSTRGAEADRRDELRRDIASCAPDWREGFFVVPPLPGMHAEDGG